MQSTRRGWRHATWVIGLLALMSSRVALAQDRDPDRSAATAETRHNSHGLMVAGFVIMGIGGTFASNMTVVAHSCLYCNAGASDAQEARYYPYVVVGGIIGAIGIPLAIAGAYPVEDKDAKKDRGWLPAPELIVGPRTAMVRWAF